MDLIERQNAINFMREYRHTNVSAETIMKMIPSAEKIGEWIPCKEKLPRLGEDVWVTVDGRSKIAYLLNRKTISEDYIKEWWSEDDWIYQLEEVTAWQPLYRPQPYKDGE